MSDRSVLAEKNNSKNAAEAHHHRQKQHQQEKKDKSLCSKSSENVVADTFLKRYKIIEKIGEGSYSEVLKCQNRTDGSIVACKRLKHNYKCWNDVNKISEVKTLKTIEKHPNILQMLEIHYEENLGKVSLVFELMDLNLYELIKDRKKLLGESRVRIIMFQLFKALRHLHKLGIFHRDIKPENILMKIKTDQLKLGDLGSVRGMFSRAPYTEYISTRWYRSPECLLTAGHYSHKMDIWAAGCVFYEVLTLRPLFPGSSELDQINRINNILGPPPVKLLKVFQKQADMERETYRGQNQLKRRQQIQKVLDGYSSRYNIGLSTNSKNSSNNSIKSNSRNTVEYHFAGREGQGLDKLLTSHITHKAKEIIKACLNYDPELRPTAHKILHFSYFSDMRDLPKNPEKVSSKEKLPSKLAVSKHGESQEKAAGSHTTVDVRNRHRDSSAVKNGAVQSSYQSRRGAVLTNSTVDKNNNVVVGAAFLRNRQEETSPKQNSLVGRGSSNHVNNRRASILEKNKVSVTETRIRPQRESSSPKRNGGSLIRTVSHHNNGNPPRRAAAAPALLPNISLEKNNLRVSPELRNNRPLIREIEQTSPLKRGTQVVRSSTQLTGTQRRIGISGSTSLEKSNVGMVPVRNRHRDSSSPKRNNNVAQMQSPYQINQHNTVRRAVAGALEKKSASVRNLSERKGNPATEKFRKEFRESQRKRSERMKSTMRDEVFCSSDDDAISSLRKKFDSLISERARKLSESLKSNPVSNVASNDFRKACDSDDNLLSPPIAARLRNLSIDNKKSKKHARRELRARMAESLTMSRFTSMHWRLPDNIYQAENYPGGSLENMSGDYLPQPSYNESLSEKSKYLQAAAAESKKFRGDENYSKNNLKYQFRPTPVSSMILVHPFSHQDRNKNRNGQIYTPPGNKPVYQSPQVAGGTMLNQRKLRYSHNITVPSKIPINSNNNNTSHSNYASSQRWRSVKDLTDLKPRRR